MQVITKALVIADTEPVLLPSGTWGCRAWLLQGMGSVAQWPHFPWSFMLWAVLLPRDFPLLLCHGWYPGGARGQGQARGSKEAAARWGALAAVSWEQPGGLETQRQTPSC